MTAGFSQMQGRGVSEDTLHSVVKTELQMRSVHTAGLWFCMVGPCQPWEGSTGGCLGRTSLVALGIFQTQDWDGVCHAAGEQTCLEKRPGGQTTSRADWCWCDVPHFTSSCRSLHWVRSNSTGLEGVSVFGFLWFNFGWNHLTVFFDGWEGVGEALWKIFTEILQVIHFSISIYWDIWHKFCSNSPQRLQQFNLFFFLKHCIL